MKVDPLRKNTFSVDLYKQKKFGHPYYTNIYIYIYDICIIGAEKGEFGC